MGIMGPKQTSLYDQYCEMRDRIDRHVASGVLSSPGAIYKDKKRKPKLKWIFSHRMDRKCFKRMTEAHMEACEKDFTLLEQRLENALFLPSL